MSWMNWQGRRASCGAKCGRSLARLMAACACARKASFSCLLNDFHLRSVRRTSPPFSSFWWKEKFFASSGIESSTCFVASTSSPVRKGEEGTERAVCEKKAACAREQEREATREEKNESEKASHYRPSQPGDASDG